MTATVYDEPYVRRFWIRAAPAALVVLGVALAALRVEPQVWGDPGVWISVGARLLEGDRLYVDVFDNKDPFFFYSYAAALKLGGVRGPFALEIIWLGVAAGGTAVALRALRVPPVAIVAASLVYPSALTAAWYVPGATVVPALALAPLALWLWARGSAVAAGCIVAVTLFVKLNLALVVVAPLATLLALGVPEGQRRRRALEAAAGASCMLVFAAVALALRGELRAYLETIAYNVYYSNAGVHDGGVSAHLDVVREYLAASGKWQLPAAELAAMLLLGVAVAAWLRGGPVLKRTSAVAVTTLAAALVTLGLTAVFGAHMQMLAYPAALGTAALVLALLEVWRPLGALAAVGCALFALWSSLKHEDVSRLTVRTWTAEPVSTPGTTLEAVRARSFGEAERVPYAVLGRNTEDGHAAFVDRALDLRCRYFHQYPFYREAQLDETLACVEHERPALVLVTTSLYDPIPGALAWEAFVARARAVLASRYELVAKQGMTQVWRRR